MMVKRIIAVAAGVCMLYGSTILPTNEVKGEPVEFNGTEDIEPSEPEVQKSATDYTYVSTRERVYGPIRPVEVKYDERIEESNEDNGEASVVQDDGRDGMSENDSVRTEPDEPELGGDEPDVSGDVAGPEVAEIIIPEDSTIVDDTEEYVEPEVEYVEEPVEEPVYEAPAEEPQYEYLFTAISTAYCNCAECCNIAGQNTASGRPPISGHTIACNVLPFFTRVMIDGTIYEVEDTGSTPFGDAWVDIYFDTHAEALAYGQRTVDVYLVS